MPVDERDLANRFYTAERLHWGIIVFMVLFPALHAVYSAISFRGFTVDRAYYLRFFVGLSFLSLGYLLFEWYSSPPLSRFLLKSQLRLTAAVAITFSAFWICYPVLTQGTSYHGIYPGWFVVYACLGFLLGRSGSYLLLATSMIRTEEDAKRLRLPQIPTATRRVYVRRFPILLILLSSYEVMMVFTPRHIHIIASFITAVIFMFYVVRRYGGSTDWMSPGNDFLDYSRVLSKFSAKSARLHEEAKGLTPSALQSAIREGFSPKCLPPNAVVTAHIEGCKVELYDQEDSSSDNAVCRKRFRIRKPDGSVGLVRVSVANDGDATPPLVYELSTELIGSHADEYLASHDPASPETLAEALAYAINKSLDAVAGPRDTSRMDGAELHRAASAGLEDEVARLLIDDTVDVNRIADAGWTPLLWASAQGYPNIVTRLLKAGANPDIGNFLWITPLMYSARYGNVSICKSLLSYGADIDKQDVYGETALIVATRCGNANVARVLVAKGARIDIKNREGKTAIDIAHETRQGDVAKMLRTAAKASKRRKPKP